MSAAQNLTFGTLAVVGVGKVVKEDEFSVKVFMAGGFLLLGISALDNVNGKLATGFAACIFSTAMYLYFPDIAKIFTGGNTSSTTRRRVNLGALDNALGGLANGI